MFRMVHYIIQSCSIGIVVSNHADNDNVTTNEEGAIHTVLESTTSEKEHLGTSAATSQGNYQPNLYTHYSQSCILHYTSL